MPPDAPASVEPAQEYLGFDCHNCHRFFSVIGPLDPVQMPPDQPLTIGARGPLRGECPHCRHHAEYPIEELKRRPLP